MEKYILNTNIWSQLIKEYKIEPKLDILEKLSNLLTNISNKISK